MLKCHLHLVLVLVVLHALVNLVDVLDLVLAVLHALVDLVDVPRGVFGVEVPSASGPCPCSPPCPS